MRTKLNDIFVAMRNVIQASGFVFDCRALPNPFWVEGLRDYTGRDQPIIDFFATHADAVVAFMKPVEDVELVHTALQTAQ